MSIQNLFVLTALVYPSNEFITKRQSAGYVPTDNIYGYDYRSSSSDDNPARLIMNPNYAYLNENFTAGFAENYVKAESTYAQSGQGLLGTSPLVPMNDAILSNEQQNSINYQRIQQTSYNRPSSTQQYTDNIYGYAYSDTPVRSGPQIVRGQTASPPSSSQATPFPNVGSQTGTAPYQSVADLKTTRLRDPTRNIMYYDSNASSGNVGNTNQAMFYPYRTVTQNVYGGNQGSGVMGTQYDSSRMSTSTLFRDPNTDPCSLPDPYWCSDYVKIYLNSSTTFNGFSRQAACQPLAQSLQDSYNGCCQTLRAAGCRT